MGKKSVDDKMHIQTLREQGLAYTSVYERKRGSGRPRTVRTPSNVELMCSQDKPGTSKSTRQTASELQIQVSEKICPLHCKV